MRGGFFEKKKPPRMICSPRRRRDEAGVSGDGFCETKTSPRTERSPRAVLRFFVLSFFRPASLIRVKACFDAKRSRDGAGVSGNGFCETKTSPRTERSPRAVLRFFVLSFFRPASLIRVKACFDAKRSRDGAGVSGNNFCETKTSPRTERSPRRRVAGAEGLEPSTKVLETHVLPLHHAPKTHALVYWIIIFVST